MIKPLAKSVLIPLGLHKKILGSGHNHPSSTTLIISNDEMEDIIKIVKSIEDSDLLLKEGTETVRNEVKEQKARFLSMLLGTLGASLLGNILTGRGTNRAGEGIVRAGYENKKGRKQQQNEFLMLPHSLTNFEIQKYYQNEPRFNGVYSRDNLPKVKDGAYVINLD